jgi:hypothetical protein
MLDWIKLEELIFNVYYINNQYHFDRQDVKFIHEIKIMAFDHPTYIYIYRMIKSHNYILYMYFSV